MNERRFYYTDPLAAAWMTKHFGMKLFVPEHRWSEQWENWTFSEAALCREVIEEDKCNGRHARYYVHPDSLYLMEPIPTEETKGGYIRHDLCHTRYAGRDCYGSYHECLGFCDDSGNIRIVQRNGIAFHWPETETAESPGQ